jgi:2-keto-3-deoxy-L-rhamnonate aldolase RhmA
MRTREAARTGRAATEFLAKVRSGSRVIGTFVRLPSVAALHLLLDDADWLDYVVLDSQHQAMNDETTSNLVALASATGPTTRKKDG